MLEKTLKSPLDCKEIKPVNPKGNQLWIFTGRTDAEAPMLCPPDMKSWLSEKHPDAGKGFPCGSAGKESAHNVGDLGSIPGLGRPPGEGKGNPLQYSGLENSMDCIVHAVAKSQTRLSDFYSLMLGKTEGRKRRGWQRMRWLDCITDSMNMSLSKLGDSERQRSLACCSPRGRKESDMTQWLNNKNNNSFKSTCVLAFI